MLLLTPRGLTKEMWLELHGTLVTSSKVKGHAYIITQPRWRDFHPSTIPVVLTPSDAIICPNPRAYSQALASSDYIQVFACSLLSLRKATGLDDSLERSNI